MFKENFFFLRRVGKINNNKVTVPMGNQVPEEIYSQLPGCVQDLYENGLGVVIDYTGQVFLYPKNHKEKR